MEQITITREQFREKILRNPKGYGIVRAKIEHPDKFPDGGELRTAIEKILQTIMIQEIEEDLFDDQEEEEQPQVVSVTINLSKED